MDDFFGSMEGRLKVSLKDSTMMWIVHFAMNKAQEKMNTRIGVIERLNAISKFYELAVMQLDGCISFVESEAGSTTLESNLEEVLYDLREIRDRLQRRLEESEFAISVKDRELKERLENEFKLRQALEMKERELSSLGANLELGKERGDKVVDNEVKMIENGEGDFSESKASVGQQMFNRKQMFEPDYNMFGQETHGGVDSKNIEEMGSVINILNQTMDLTFGKMTSALSTCKMGPKEKQWKMKLEKDIMSILIKSFMREFQENIEAQLRKQEEVLNGWWEHWPQLMKEVTILQHELVPFMQGICAEDTNSTCELFSGTNFEQKAFQESEGKPSPEETSHSWPKRSSPKGEEVNQMKEDKEEESNFVAKMIKNHESIIRQKSEKPSSCVHGILQEKKSLPTKRGKEQDSLKTRIQDVAARLDSLLNWNAELTESLYQHRVVHKKDTLPVDRLSEFLVLGKVEENNDTFASSWERIEGFSHASNEQQDKIREFKQEKDRKIKGMVLQGKDLPLHRSIEEEFDSNSDLERQIQEDICKYYLKELISQWNENIERNQIERQIRDEAFFIVVSEAFKDNCLIQNFDLAECQGSGTQKYGLECSSSSDRVGDIEGTIREDMCVLIFSEMVKEYNRMLEAYNSESLVKEDKCQIVLTEKVKNASRDCLVDSIEENLLKEDVFMVVFRGMFKDWKMELGSYYVENLISEEINECIMIEALKDSFNLSREVKSPIQGNIMEDAHSTTIMQNQGQNVKGEEKFLRILESLVKCFEAEEYLMVSAKTEMKEHSRQLDLGSERGELHEHEIFEDLIADEEQTLCSVTSKVEKTLQLLSRSKALLRDLVNSLGHMASESEKMHSQTTISEKKIKSSVYVPLLEFSQIFAEFEVMVNSRLEIVSARMERMKYFLDSVIELAVCLRNKELLYQKAFIRRSQNLIKAEAEVDLLGDQVDALESILEKICEILHQYAPALQQYFEVSDILELIRKELIGGAATGASVV